MKNLLTDDSDSHFITLFYGTSNSKLHHLDDIDPMHQYKEQTTYNEGMKIFEFGGGFYLTPHLNIALDYAFTSYALNNIPTDENCADYVNGKYRVYIHMLKIKKSLLHEKSIRLCEDVPKFYSALKSTLNGYNTKSNYYPDVYLTKGFLCGDYWDNKFKNNSYTQLININSSADTQNSFLVACILNRKYAYDDNDNKIEAIQYCLHKDTNVISYYSRITLSDAPLSYSNNILTDIKRRLESSGEWIR